MKKLIPKKYAKYPYRPSEVPVSQGMLYGIRDELIATMNSRFESVEAKLHRMGVLMEEQNSKNNVVLDGLGNLFHRQERLEDDVSHFGKIVSGLK